MSHLILLTALALYAAGVFLTLRSVGLGVIQTLTSGLVTIAFVWGALHLVYVSDALYSVGLVALPASVAWNSVPFAWLWRYIALNGWLVGIAFYVPIWLSAALVRLLQQQRNRSIKPNPLRESA
jgi:hypothetical protein